MQEFIFVLFLPRKHTVFSLDFRNTNMDRNNFIVLYAEDDFEEFDLFREALQRFDRSIQLYHARNGVHALNRSLRLLLILFSWISICP